MMTNQDLDNLYKKNIAVSHAAALRGVFDAGVQWQLGQQPTTQTQDASQTADAATATASNDTPIINQP